MYSFRFKVEGLGFRVQGLGFGVLGLQFGVLGLGFGVLIFGCCAKVPLRFVRRSDLLGEIFELVG